MRMLLMALFALTGCTEAPPAAEAPKAPAAKPAQAALAAAPEAAKVEAPKVEAPKVEAPKVAAVAPNALTTGQARGKPEIEWDGPVAWTDWEAGKAQAKKDEKPICLVVYADWCPRCRELAPAFGEEKIAKLAEKMVMVRQNSDVRPAWLEELSSFGSYVPRVFFLKPDGSLREELTSGHPRYPYFYTPKGLDALAKSMQAAIDG